MWSLILRTKTPDGLKARSRRDPGGNVKGTIPGVTARGVGSVGPKIVTERGQGDFMVRACPAIAGHVADEPHSSG